MPGWGSRQKTNQKPAEAPSQPSLADLQVELRTSRQRLANLNKERDGLLASLTEVQVEDELLGTQYANLQGKMSQIQTEKQLASEEVDALQRDLENSEHDTKKLREQIERLRSRRAVLEIACEQLPKPSGGMVPSPLSQVAIEAAGLAQNLHTSLEQRLAEIDLKTVEYDRGRGVFEAEEQSLAQQLEGLKSKDDTLRQLHAGLVDDLTCVTNDVERLQMERDDLVGQLAECSKALYDAEQAREVLAASIVSQRQNSDAVRGMAWDEISEVRSKCSKTNRVQQYAVLESEKQQKDLLSFASAHAQYISTMGTHQTAVQLPSGLLDTGSPEMKRAIQQASQPRSARGRRSEFRDFGNIIVRSS